MHSDNFIITPNLSFLSKYKMYFFNAHEILVNFFLFLIFIHVLKAVWAWSANLRKPIFKN